MKNQPAIFIFFLFLKPLLADPQLRYIENIGYQIYIRDHYSALAQELLLNSAHSHIFNDPNNLGYICFFKDNKCIVKWVQKSSGNYAALAQVIFDLENETHSIKTGQPISVLTDFETQIYNSWKNALASIKDSALCSNNYNPVVFPPESEGEPWEVYLLPASPDPNIIIAEGAYKVTLLGSGHYPDNIERLSIECIYKERSKGLKFNLNQYLTYFPTEYHVYLTLFFNIELEIKAHDYTWKLLRGEISPIK